MSENRMRIGMFTNVYLPTTNGVVVSVETFRKALTRLGHDVFVFGPDCGEIEDRAPYIFRYPAVELPLQKYPLTLPVSPYIDRLLPALKPHVLHANHPALLGRVAARKSQEMDLPLVFTYHTRYAEYSHYAEPLPQENVKDFIHSWLASFMEECHWVVVPSESIRDMLEEHYGITRGVSVVPTGIETERFGKVDRAEARRVLGWSDELTYLVSIGRLAKEKSFDMLIEAFAKLQRQDCRLVIIGSGDEGKALEQKASDLGVRESVEFTGLVPFEKVATYLGASDLFTFASVTETQGLVTLEALASGLPVVAVDASGTREAVDDTCAFLTEHSAEAVAEGIQRMLEREDLGELRDRAQARAAGFDILSQGRAMLEVYRNAQRAHSEKRTVLKAAHEWQRRWEEFLDFFR